MSIEVYAADGSKGGTGKAVLKGLQIGDSIGNWSLVVPSNISPGPFNEGSVVSYQLTMRNPAGEEMYGETGMLKMGESRAERDAKAAAQARELAYRERIGTLDKWWNTVYAELKKQSGKSPDESWGYSPTRWWGDECYQENGRFPDAAWVAKTYLATGKWPVGE
ncbi:hypothetical protein ACWELJ_10740 [Nocardia sp. NPDC004582]